MNSEKLGKLVVGFLLVALGAGLVLYNYGVILFFGMLLMGVGIRLELSAERNEEQQPIKPKKTFEERIEDLRESREQEPLTKLIHKDNTYYLGHPVIVHRIGSDERYLAWLVLNTENKPCVVSSTGLHDLENMCIDIYPYDTFSWMDEVNKDL